MALFRRRDGEPIDVPSIHAHEVTLSQRRNETEAKAGEVRARIAQLETDKADAFLEGRIEDGTSATTQLEAARAELATLEAIGAALLEAAQAVNAERQKLDMQTRIAECKAARDEIAERCRQVITDLPIVIAEAQQLARQAQSLDQEYRDAEGEMRTLQHNLAHFGQAQYDALPRYGVSSPIAAEWNRHPEYQALANGNWFTGVVGGPQ
jgi:chromosome segregation ATPase